MTPPEGWAAAAVGDLVAPIETDDPSKSPDIKIRYVDIGSIDNAALRIVEPKEILGRDAPSRARRRIRTNDVLFATVRPYLKNIAMVPADLHGEFTSTGICVLRAIDGIEPGYLFRRVISQDFIDAMTTASDGTMYPAIADRDVFSGSIALPPTAEQRRIVEKLDALTARITRARAELAQVPVLARRLREAAVETMLRPEAHGGKAWGARPLGSLLLEGPSNGWSPKSDPGAQGALTLKLTATTSGKLRLDEAAVKRIHDVPAPESTYWLRSGDLLVQRANALEHVGAAAIFNGPDQTYIYPDLMMRLRFPDPLLTRLVWYRLNSPTTRRHFRERAIGTAGNMPKINGKVVRELPIALPPQREWAHLAARLDAAFARADQLQAEAGRARTLLDRLEAAILARAFRGELVPQDPSDEPASVLLDRIRAHRAAAPKPKRGRRAIP